MKINWGTGILLCFSLFAGVLFCQVYETTTYDRSLLVTNPYEKNTAFKRTFHNSQDTSQLTEPLKLTFYEGFHLVELQFPKDKKQISGQVLFYRPSTNKLHVRLPIMVDCENVMDIFVREHKKTRNPQPATRVILF